MLLIDALREDFVQFEGNEHVRDIPKFLDLSKSVYQGSKMKLLQRLASEYPD